MEEGGGGRGRDEEGMGKKNVIIHILYRQLTCNYCE